jgi:hypothetical protein
MVRLSKSQVAELIKLYSEGTTVKELVIKYGVSQPTICYHINPEVKKKTIERTTKNFKLKTPEQRKLLTQSRKEYLKAYMKRRYHSDPVFRQKCIDRQGKKQ